MVFSVSISTPEKSIQRVHHFRYFPKMSEAARSLFRRGAERRVRPFSLFDDHDFWALTQACIRCSGDDQVASL